LNTAKLPESIMLDTPEALHAIGATGKGRCWYCDVKLPRAEIAIDLGWYVQRVEGERVASIILVCPTCLRQRAELGEDEFLRNLSLRVCNATC
jgi:hypothetical protein